MRRIFSILFALALVLAFSLVVATPVAAAVIVVPPGPPGTLAAFVAGSSPGDILQLTPGWVYIEPQIIIPWNLTIMGLPGPKPIINPIPNSILQGNNAANAWFLVSPGVTFVLQDVMVDGTPTFVHQAIRNHGMTTIQNVDFLNIRGSLSGNPYRGIGIQSYGGLVPGGGGSDSHGLPGMPPGQLSVIGCTFQGMGRIGVLVKGTLSTATVSGCTYTGRGTGDWLDYGVEIGAGGQGTITGNTMTNCGDSTTAWASAGILVTDAYGPGSAATITGNNLSNNEYGIAAAYNASDASVVTANFNNISGNVEGIHTPSTVVTTDGECNWWGDASGPSHSGNPGGIGDIATDFVDYTPWLTEPYAPQRSVAAPGGTATFDPDQGSIEDLTAMAPPTPPPATVTLPYGMFNFTVCCFSGTTATLSILLPGPVPVGTKWYKYNGGNWDALPIGDDNGDNFITVTLTDNNPVHDEDPTQYRIVDQGGPGYGGGAVGWETYPVSKMRVFLPWIALFAAIIAGVSLLVVRRRRVRS